MITEIEINNGTEAATVRQAALEYAVEFLALLRSWNTEPSPTAEDVIAHARMIEDYLSGIKTVPGRVASPNGPFTGREIEYVRQT